MTFKSITSRCSISSRQKSLS